MEDKQREDIPQDQGYEPRPTWQLWLARIGLVIFIGFVILQVVQIYNGFR